MNGRTFQLFKNIGTWQYWQKETKKNIKHRIQPGYKTCIEDYAEIFDSIQQLVTGMLNLTLFKDTPFKARDGTIRMMTIIYSNKDDLEQMALETIRDNELKFKNQNQLTKPHKGAIFCFLQEHHYWEINEKVLDELYNLFAGQFDREVLCRYAQDMGALYNCS